MKILPASAIREWDQYTITHEPVTSIDLMERAALQCTEWIMRHYPAASNFSIFCGKGNNGGDGLAIARQLLQHNFRVTVYILEFGHLGTQDFQDNLARLHQLPGHEIQFVQNSGHFPSFGTDTIIIDALFGSGLNRALDGLTADLVTHINASGNTIISIDIPSGLFVDRSSKDNIVISATHTLTFQCYKIAFLVPENAHFIGEVHVLNIGLDPTYLHDVPTNFELTDTSMIKKIYRPRNAFSHKGTFGHALLIAGSKGKMGAAVLASRACMHAGIGLLTAEVPSCGYEIMQVCIPEVMISSNSGEDYLNMLDPSLKLEKYNAVGVGPGISVTKETTRMLADLLNRYRSQMVLDADALNLLGESKELVSMLPTGSILTPHPKEFERLFGTCANDFDRIDLAMRKSTELSCVIVLKGHHTLIATPGGKGFFNSTGNAGMSTAGSGDVLTGILTSLLAQGYAPAEAAQLGVYLHGLAGDIEAMQQGQEAVIASGIIRRIGAAWMHIANENYTDGQKTTGF